MKKNSVKEAASIEEYLVYQVSEIADESNLTSKAVVKAALEVISSSLKSKYLKDDLELYNVWLESYDTTSTVSAIKAVREIMQIGLKEAKDLLESTPVLLKENISLQEVDEISHFLLKKGIQFAVERKKVEDLFFASQNKIKENSVEETQLELLSLQSMGLNPDEIPLSRVIPVNIYLASGDNSQEILSALREFLIAFDFLEVGDSPAIIASFFKRLWYRTTNKATLDELKSKLKKMEDALETQQIDKPKSEIDLNHATAAEKLLNALGNDSKSTAMHIGNILVLVLVDEHGEKHNRVITLTKEQIEIIQHDQNLLRKPELLLQHFNQQSKKIVKK